MDDIEEIGSMQGTNGAEDFVKLNSLLNSEGYAMLRFILHWQNVTYIGGKEVTELLETQMNEMTKGQKRRFSKKLIDTFRLNA